MYTLPQIYDMFAALPTGGYITADSRLQKGQMYSVINKCKNRAQKIVYAQERVTHPMWWMTFYPEYDSTWQPVNGCFKRFRMPDYNNLDGVMSGIGYVGAIDTLNTFLPIESRVQLSDWMKHPILAPRSQDVYILIENGWCYVYSMVREFQMMIIPSNPQDNPNYNVDNDPYPVDGALLELMTQIAIKGEAFTYSRTKVDLIQDGRDSTAINT